MALSDLIIKVGANIAEFESAMAAVSTRVGAISDEITNRFKGLDQLGSTLTTLGAGITAAFAVPATAIGASVKAFADFDQAMTQSLAIQENISAAMKTDLSNAAITLSQNISVSAKDAAASYYYLASAGLSVADQIGALPTIANFAKAGLVSMNDSAAILTRTQFALGMQSKDTATNLANMAQIADVVVKADTLALGRTQEFADALTNKGATAMKKFNVSLLDGISILAAYSEAGIRGQQAGTYFEMMIRQFTTSIAKHGQAWDDLKVKVYDAATGAFRSPIAIISDLQNALAGLSDKQREAQLLMLGFQPRALFAVTPLLGLKDTILDLRNKFEDFGGTAARVAGAQMQTFNEQIKIVWQRVTDLGIVVGQALMPAIVGLMQALNPAVQAVESLARSFQALPPWLQATIVGSATLVTGLGLLTGGFMLLGGIILKSVSDWTIAVTLLTKWATNSALVQAAFEALAPVITTTSIGITGVGSAIGALTLLTAPAIAALLATKNQLDALTDSAKKFDAQLRSTSIRDALKAGQSIEDLQKVGYSLDQIKAAVNDTGLALSKTGAISVSTWASVEQSIAKPIDTLKQLGFTNDQIAAKLVGIQSGAITAFTAIKNGATIDQLKQLGFDIGAVSTALNSMTAPVKATSKSLLDQITILGDHKSAANAATTATGALTQSHTAAVLAFNEANKAYLALSKQFVAGAAERDQVQVAWNLAAEAAKVAGVQFTGAGGAIGKIGDAYSDWITKSDKFTAAQITHAAKVADLTKAYFLADQEFSLLLDAMAKGEGPLETLTHALDGVTLSVNNLAPGMKTAGEVLSVMTTQASAGADAVGDAMSRLKVKSSTELGATAAQAAKDFQTISDSGIATKGEIDQAYMAMTAADQAWRKSMGEPVETNKLVAAFEAVARSGTSTMDQVEAAFSAASVQINRLARTDLPAAVQAYDAYIDALKRTGAPIGEIYSAQEKELQLEITMREQRGQSATELIIQLENIKIKQDALIDASSRWGNVYVDSINAVKQAFSGLNTGFATVLSGALFGADNNTKLNQQVTDLKQSLSDRTAAWQQYQTDNAAAMVQLTIDNGNELAKQVKSVNDALGDQQKAYDDFATETQTKLDGLPKKYADDLAKQTKSLTDSLGDQKKAYDDYAVEVAGKIQDLEAANTRSLSDSLGALKRSLDDKTTAYNDYVNGVTTSLSRIQETLAEDISNQTTSKTRGVEDKNKEYDRFQADTLEKINDLKKAGKTENDEAVIDLRTALARKKEDLDTYTKRATEDLATYTKEHKENAKQQTDDLNTQLAQRTRDYNDFVADNKTLVTQTTTDHAAALAKQESDLNKSLAKRLSDYNTASDDTIQKIKDITDANALAQAAEEKALKDSLKKKGDALDAYKGDVVTKLDDLNKEYAKKLTDGENALSKSLDNQRDSYDKFVTDTNNKLEDIKTQYKSIWGDIENMIAGPNGVFSRMATSMLEGFLKPITKGMQDLMTGVIADLLGKNGFGGISDAITKLGGQFTGGGGLLGTGSGLGSATGGVAAATDETGTIAGEGATAAGQAASGVGGAAASAGSLLSSASSFANIATAISSIGSGIVTGFQLSHIGSDVNFIEKSTRYAWLTLGGGAGSIAESTKGLWNATTAWYEYIRAWYHDAWVELLDDMGKLVSGGGITSAFADGSPILTALGTMNEAIGRIADSANSIDSYAQGIFGRLDERVGIALDSILTALTSGATISVTTKAATPAATPVPQAATAPLMTFDGAAQLSTMNNTLSGISMILQKGFGLPAIPSTGTAFEFVSPTIVDAIDSASGMIGTAIGSGNRYLAEISLNTGKMTPAGGSGNIYVNVTGNTFSDQAGEDRLITRITREIKAAAGR